MPLMKEWCMKCKIYMKIRMLIILSNILLFLYCLPMYILYKHLKCK